MKHTPYYVVGIWLILLISVSGCVNLPANELQNTEKEMPAPINSSNRVEHKFVQAYNETGTGSKTTAPFQIKNGEVILLAYGYVAESELAAPYASLNLYLYKVGSNIYETYATLSCKEIKCDVRSSFAYNLEPGEYYLRIIEANTLGWVIGVLDYD